MCDPPTTPRVEQAEGPVVERSTYAKRQKHSDSVDI